MFLRKKIRLLDLLSIRTRLTLLYTAGAFVLICLIGILLYWQTVNVLLKADYQFLDDEVATIRGILHNKKYDPYALQLAVIKSPIKTENSIYRYFIRIFNTNGIIMETPGMREIISPDQVNYVNKKKYLWYNKNKTSYLLIEAPLFNGNKITGQVQIMLDISYQHKLAQERRKLVLFLLFGLLAASLLGFLLTKRGLKSLKLLTETTQNITAGSLHQRINTNAWPAELKSLAYAFNHMLDRIESSFSSLKQFTGDLAHELRIPITNLIVSNEVVLAKNAGATDYQDVLISNLEELRRLSQLMDNLLFLARNENPRLILDKNEINIADEIHHLFEYFAALAEEKNISLHCDGIATVSANPFMFRRMLNNLISNAIKYTNAGGNVCLSVTQHENQVMIKIADTGIGIPQEHLDSLFNRFYRVDASRNPDTGGSGLGLAIVKSIVDLHKGNITLESHPGLGTTITLLIPKD